MGQLTLINQGKRMDFKVKENGIIKFQDKVCISNLPKLKNKILEEGHMSSLNIHHGATKLYQDLKRMF